MITSGQQLFINSAIPALKRDARIAGVAIGGSYIRRETMDEFSGIDFIIAVNEESWEEVLRDRVEIAMTLGTLLASFTGEHIQKPDQLICLYDDPLTHVDLDFVRVGEVGARFEEPVVMFQRESLLYDEFSKRPPMVPVPDLQWFEDRFWIWVHFIATRIGRGELFDAIESLSFLRLNVLGPLISMKNGFPSRGVRHIERDCPDDARMLTETLASYDKKSCLRALKGAANLYISLRGVNKASLFLRDKAESRALRYLSHISDMIS
ncbi:MAG: oxalate:formate antiporter [Oscillospiraceae bacterium]|jgi:predicted nucleotidyltransferase|nr:oxalate:formate antiporter [Oscillospiraceae bacterium]